MYMYLVGVIDGTKRKTTWEYWVGGLEERGGGIIECTCKGWHPHYRKYGNFYV